MKAADVDEKRVLAVIRANAPKWTMTYQLEREFPEVPYKVLLAKMRSLVKRGIIGGCACGCRGDFVEVKK